MLIGTYTVGMCLTLAINAFLVKNILLFYFLGMCSFLACSSTIKAARGLGYAVTIVMTLSGIVNWFIHQYITRKGALHWISIFGINGDTIDLSYLEVLIFIIVIATLVQILEIILKMKFQSLYRSLGIYLPLITVNCAILGACLFASLENLPFIPHCIFMFFSGLGWLFAITILASIKEKFSAMDIPYNLQGVGITFITTGLIALSFLGFAGMDLTLKNENMLPVLTHVTKERDIHSHSYNTSDQELSHHFQYQEHTPIPHLLEQNLKE